MPVSILDNRTLLLHGAVGGAFAILGESWFDSREVVLALSDLGDGDISVRLNSPGGDAGEGLAIHAALAQHRGAINVIVEGVAASAGSVIASAGDTVRMAPSALVMMHDASMATFGTSAEHARSIEVLEKLSGSMAGVYAARTGSTPEQMRELMKVETWWTATEAVEAGFADGIDAANDAEPAAYAYGRAYAHAPARIAALASKRGWNHQAARKGDHVETQHMTKSNAGAPPANAERARIAAIIDAEQAKGREALARHLAFSTDLAPEVAATILAAAPAAQADHTPANLSAQRAAAASLAFPPISSPSQQRTPLRWGDFRPER